MSETRPAVLFLCTHNAGRSQMAVGFLQHIAKDQVAIYSGGSEPANEINPIAVQVMAEKGIDITGQKPKRWTLEVIDAVQIVVTMGCGDTCPYVPGKRYENWELADPAGQEIESIRCIRDDIEMKVRKLAGELGFSSDELGCTGA